MVINIFTINIFVLLSLENIIFMCTMAFYCRGHISFSFCKNKMPPAKWLYLFFFILPFGASALLDLYCLFEQNWFWIALKHSGFRESPKLLLNEHMETLRRRESTFLDERSKKGTKEWLSLPFLKRVIKVMLYKNYIFCLKGWRKS